MNDRTYREQMGRVAGVLREQLNDMMAAAHEMGGLISQSGRGAQSIAVLNRCLCQQLRLVRHLELEHRLTSEDEVRLDLAPVDLVELCRRLTEQVEGVARLLDIRVTFETSLAALLTCADRARVEDMLLCLVSNSARAIGRDGDIRITLERRGEQAILSVIDNGGGAGAQVLAEFFGQAEEEWDIPESPALGLGLPLARRIAALHGGFLLADNYEGQGMRVVAALQCREPDGSSTLRAPRPVFQTGGWDRVLVELSDCLPIEPFAPKELYE